MARQGRRAASLLRVLAAPRARPLANLAEIAKRAAVSCPPAAAGARALVRLGIARETTGRRRNRVFTYRRHLAILAEGTEPL